MTAPGSALCSDGTPDHDLVLAALDGSKRCTKCPHTTEADDYLPLNRIQG